MHPSKSSRLRLLRVCGAALQLAVSVAASAADSYVSYTGTATAIKDGHFLYGENHVLHERDGSLRERVVLYTCRNGAPFARKTVAYVDPLAPDFALEDVSNGFRQGIRSDAGVRRVFFRNNASSAEKSAVLPRDAALVADSGFDEFVRTHWQALTDGQTLPMNFLVPSRLQAMAFKVEHVRGDRIDTVPVEVFRLKVAGVIGWVVPSIDVAYGSRDRVLIRYDGLSDLRDPSNDNFTAHIEFRPADRSLSDEARMASARQVPLRACG